MTSRGSYYDMGKQQFSMFEGFMKWDNLGELLGADKLNEAKALGESIG